MSNVSARAVVTNLPAANDDEVPDFVRRDLAAFAILRDSRIKTTRDRGAPLAAIAASAAAGVDSADPILALLESMRVHARVLLGAVEGENVDLRDTVAALQMLEQEAAAARELYERVAAPVVRAACAPYSALAARHPSLRDARPDVLRGTIPGSVATKPSKPSKRARSAK